MAAEPEPDGPEGLSAEDARALARLLQRGLGKGFRLVVIEVATWRVRSGILAWVRDQLAPPGEVAEIDVATLAGENLWSELGERVKVESDTRLVLALHGFQDAVHGQPDARSGVYRQLNVQRDLFVRDLGCVWLVMIHPQGSRHMQDIAPDFCDFVSLWVHAKESMGAWPPANTPTTTFLLESPLPLFPDLQKISNAINLGCIAEARDLLDSALLAFGPDKQPFGQTLLLQSELELIQGNLSMARRAAEIALSWGETHDIRIAVAALDNLGAVSFSLGQHDRALDLFEQSRARKASLDGEASPSVAHTLRWIATTLRSQGILSLARSHIERALAIQFEFLGRDHPDISASLNILAAILRDLGDLEHARAQIEHALDLINRHFGDSAPQFVANLFTLATIVGAQGDLAGARLLLERALHIELARIGGDLHPSIASTLQELAAILHAQGEISTARLYIQRALSIHRTLFGTEQHPSIATALHTLAAIHRAEGDLRGARELLVHVLAIDTAIHGGRDNYNSAIAETGLARVLIECGELDLARRHAAHAYQVLVTSLGPGHAMAQQAARSLAEASLHGQDHSASPEDTTGA